MRTAVIVAVCVAAASGCAAPARPVPVVLPVGPFDDDPVSFLVSARRITPGEVAIVKVCVSPDRTIISASVLESSGDARFDSMAVDWARLVKLRSAPENGAPMAPCGQVRVEVRAPSEPRVLSAPDTSVG
jgi:TonB family protein